MGRKPKPEHEKKTTLFLRVPNPLLWEIEEIAERNNIKVNDYIINILKEKIKK